MKQTGVYLIYYADNCANLFVNIQETVCETCMNGSCSKTETLLTRTDTFDAACFLYASLLRIFKAKTIKRTLLQTDNFFQSSDEKATSLTRTQIKSSGISEKQRIKLDIFVNFLKKKYFFRLSSDNNFFWAVRYFWVEPCIFFFFRLLSVTKQQMFCVTESDIGQGPSNHSPPLYELLVSVVWLRLSFGKVSKTCRRMH